MGKGVRDRISRMAGAEVGSRELWLVLGVIAAGLALRIIVILATKDYTLQGDQIEYNQIGIAAADGHWFWTTFPYGVIHESVARPPGYMAWVGATYSILGVGVTKTLMVQSLIGPFVIFMVWLLARRLFNPRVALLAAVFAAFYPNMWQWETRLYSEALALPLGALLLLVVLERPVTTKLAVGAGAIMGASLLVRPTQVFFYALILAAFWIGAGFKRGVALTALSIAVAALMIAPWTIRNYHVSHHFVPLSVQDAALGGTFNPDAAADKTYPWAWRPSNSRDLDITGAGATRKLPDAELRDELQSRAFDYIKDHPSSVPKAFFWNGLVRTWDIRTPTRILDEVQFEGRERPIAKVGMVMWWILLVAAIAALWRERRRKALVIPVLAAAAAMSIVFTVAAATRYRVPFEPIVVILACSTFVALWDRVRGKVPEPPASPASAAA